jgi:hypothetical protein
MSLPHVCAKRPVNLTIEALVGKYSNLIIFPGYERLKLIFDYPRHRAIGDAITDIMLINIDRIRGNYESKWLGHLNAMIQYRIVTLDDICETLDRFSETDPHCFNNDKKEKQEHDSLGTN